MNLSGRNFQILLVIFALLWAGIVLRNAFDRKGPEDFVHTATSSDVVAFARTHLNSLQARSFAEDIELCGIIYEDSDGNLGTSGDADGDEATCDIQFFDRPGMAPVASFHTHGSHSWRYDAEAPSLIDFRSDISSGIDGFISTPGGRFWRIDGKAARAEQICGEGCLLQDPKYERCPSYAPAESYDLAGLRARTEQQPTNC